MQLINFTQFLLRFLMNMCRATFLLALLTFARKKGFSQRVFSSIFTLWDFVGTSDELISQT